MVTDTPPGGERRARAIRGAIRGAIRITPEPALAGQDPAMISTAEQHRLIETISKVVGDSLAKVLPCSSREAKNWGAEAVAAFFALYPRRPLSDNRGGSGFNDSLWLFAMARAIAPRLIIESGTHKGHSAWLFRKACPDAMVHSFDIAPERLSYREPGVTYHSHDWSETDLGKVDPARSLIFFDDHISHAARIREAHARGFRLLLLDDNFPAHNLYATGGPPVPTLAMITDPDLAFDSDITWFRKGKTYSYRYSADDVGDARQLIADWMVLPDLAPLTRFPPGSALTFVRLDT